MSQQGRRGISCVVVAATVALALDAGFAHVRAATGSITEFTLHTAGSEPYGMTAGPDGRMWFTEASGNTVKVTVSSATKITKSQSASKSSLHPGDAVVIQGATGKNGTVAAASVSDSGARTALTGAGGGSSGSTTTSNSTGTTGTGTTG